MRRLLPFLVLAGCSRPSVPAATTSAPAAAGGATATPIAAEALMAHARALAADSMEGRAIGTPGGARARAYVLRAFRDAGLQPIGASFEVPFEARARDGATRSGVNLVGVVRGRTDPERYLVVSAHYDHVGVRDGQTYNGADDNASGTGALIEIARALAARPPEHSVIVAAFDGEEIGLQGAQAFVRTPPVPLARVVLNVNMDMVGRNARNELYAAGASHSPFLRPFLDSVAARAPITLRLGHDDPNGPRQDDWTSQSDQGAFHRARVPFVYFGVEDHPDYHKPTDDAERLMPAFYAGAASTVLDAVRTLDRHLAAIDAARPRP
ncbi:M28 family peptidase [Roseisolibacter sp. H3M3-2]|uniref:M28 family peptidase n=1 Tax=Roseisolibacter sp. H3M3-2 TaxID=3031323 RepID=UPI0023DB43D6|nr:M28 family peptidase [Roseisolibacter sp. H3M3-2]MDF1503063.1 M28 family peptidase [Roseisolibacter sp. H3M3-2]